MKPPILAIVGHSPESHSRSAQPSPELLLLVPPVSHGGLCNL